MNQMRILQMKATEKIAFRKIVFIGICLGIFAGAVGVTYAIVSDIYSHNAGLKEITFTKGHTTQLSFELPTEGGLVVPGESKNIEAKLTNGSDTDSAYVFLELQKK
jgi:hypothetical protein